MSVERPVPVGNYSLLEDFECPTASIRVIQLKASDERVEPHAHRRSMQLYVVLSGEAVVESDNIERRLEPYTPFAVWPGSAHGLRPVTEEAIVMNISIPPLAADDQAPLGENHLPPDYRLPGESSDVED
jgi:mannose-6-phosphate isomerase-like protein (cupin superfamily)